MYGCQTTRWRHVMCVCCFGLMHTHRGIFPQREEGEKNYSKIALAIAPRFFLIIVLTIPITKVDICCTISYVALRGETLLLYVSKMCILQLVNALLI